MIPVGQVLGKFTEKKCTYGGIFWVVNHVHVDDMDWCLRVSLTGCKALQDLIINLLLNCQDDLKLSATLLEPFWARLRKYFKTPLSNYSCLL